MRSRCSLFAFALLVTYPVFVQAADEPQADPAQAGPDYAIQGEYVGEVAGHDEKQPWGAQVIALGGGKFHTIGYLGGLPGAGWDGEKKHEADGQREGDAVKQTSAEFNLTIKDGTITVTDSGGNVLGTLKKIERKSPTLGAKAPEGAIILFDGTTAEHFEGGKMTEDGLLMQGVTSKQKFGDHSIHIEFRLPFMPDARGQGRGNSGFYMQGRHEVQMLDSFGLSGENNECGGIYTIAKPAVNMCYPPLAWQTYDVDFTAAQYADGKKVKNARATVRHNGIVIHDNVELTHATTASPLKEGPETGPVYLQNHGNPVRYRNIWVVEGEE